MPDVSCFDQHFHSEVQVDALHVSSIRLAVGEAQLGKGEA